MKGRLRTLIGTNNKSSIANFDRKEFAVTAKEQLTRKTKDALNLE